MDNPLIPAVKYATLITTGDGVNTAWEFNFAGGYISPEHVKAFTEDVATGEIVLRPLTLIGPSTAQITPAVAAGLRLIIYRDTPKTEPLVNYSTGSILNESSLDKSNLQAVFIAAELADRVVADYDFSNALLYAVTTATAAAATANGIDAKATQALEFAAAANAVTDTLAGPTGSNHIGWVQYGIATKPRPVQEKLRESISILDFYANGVDGPRVDPTGIIDSTAGIQAAWNSGARVYMPTGRYKVTSTLTFKGKRRIFGDGMGRTVLSWFGALTGNIIQDSSIVTSTDINLNFELSDFEVAGNSYSSNSLYAIRTYRTGRCKYKNLYLHDVGGSLLLWGVSQADTVDVKVSDCIFERAYNGDAAQGIGRRVTVKDCYAFSSGDTCYALLYDTQSATNPTYKFTAKVVFDNCVAEGEYDENGVFQGVGRPTQLGFSFGPFNTGVNIHCSITNCVCEGLYQNVWMVVFGKLKLADNTFKQHANLETSGVRLDGVSNVVIKGNSFEAKGSGTTPYYGSLLLNAFRNVYGSSVFDASNRISVVSGNTFEHDTAPAIVLAVDPAAPVVISDLTISDNTFAGVTRPVQFSPLTGSGEGVFRNINISGNTCDAAATSLVTCNGSPAQYVNVVVADNATGAVPPVSGQSDNISVSHTRKLSVAGVENAVATTVYTLPTTGFNAIQAQFWVQAGTQRYTAIAMFVLNAGEPRIVWKSDGSDMAITLVGRDIKITQSGIGTQTVYGTVKYIS